MCRKHDIGSELGFRMTGVKVAYQMPEKVRKNANSEAAASRAMGGAPPARASRARLAPCCPAPFSRGGIALRGTLRAAGNRRHRRSTSASRALARFYHRSRSHSHSRSHSRVRSRSHSLTCGTYPRSAFLAASKPSMTRWHLEGHSSCSIALSRRLRPS